MVALVAVLDSAGDGAGGGRRTRMLAHFRGRRSHSPVGWMPRAHAYAMLIR